MLNRIASRWNNHFYKNIPAEYLAIQRIIFFGFLSFYTFFFEVQQYSYWRLLPDSLWFPVGVFTIFKTPPLSYELLMILEVMWPWALLLSAIGLFTRVFTLLSFLMHFTFVGCSLSYGEGSFDQLLTSIFLLIFALSRSGDQLSLDYMIGPKLVKKDYTNYFWPIRLQQWVFCAFFMGAAVSKLSLSGLSWIFSDTLSNYMLYAYYRRVLSPWVLDLSIGLWLSTIPWLSKLLAAGVIFLELFSSLSIFLKNNFKYIFMLSHLFMSISFFFVVTEGFFNIIAFYICWFADFFYKTYVSFCCKKEYYNY